MESDPNGQFAWLINELQNAESAGERVYILGHMPMVSLIKNSFLSLPHLLLF